MTFRRAGRLAAMVLLTLLCLSCGQVYRPVVIPTTVTSPTPANFHAVFAISANVPNYPGGAMQIDVAGDSIIGETPTSDKSAHNLGNNPTYAAILPNNSRVFVTSAGSLAGGTDEVSFFGPAFQSTFATGLSAVNSISLSAGSLPVFVTTTQSNAVYVANFGTGSVNAINVTTNVITNTATVGVNPVAMAETPNGNKLYVANQGSNSVSSLNTVDLSSNTVTGFTGTTPVWVVARADSQKVYVLTQGDGSLVTIDTATDTVTSSIPVGAGANFIFYDPQVNRLYVTNPMTSTVYVFSDTGGPGDTPNPVPLATIHFGPASPACPTGCAPASVTALRDGSRFYVASYQTAASCPDPFAATAAACIVPSVAVFDANNFALRTTLTLLTDPPFAADLTAGQYQYAVPQVTACLTPAVYSPSPSATRFRVFTTASVDSSRVYVSVCDAGVIAVINTTNSNVNNTGGGGTPPDTVVVDLPAAFSSGPPQANGEPPNQSPIFLLTGQ